MAQFFKKWSLKYLKTKPTFTVRVGAALLTSFTVFGVSFGNDRYSTVYSSSKAPKQIFEDDVRKDHYLEVAAWQIPHPHKKLKGGEDTYFISSFGYSFGVFDGVGGWADDGVDSREYSYTLSQACKYAVDHKQEKDPIQILKSGYEAAKGITGSSTACVVSITDNKCQGANLGDSSYLIIRNEKLLFKSIEQQFSFNFPFQLGSNNLNVPTDAAIASHPLESGDIIILVTDGVLDNISPRELTTLASAHKELPSQNIASKIASNAYTASHQEQGKVDDITVLVCKLF